MGDKWSKLVKDASFGSLGDGNAKIAKLTYEGIEDPKRFILVKEGLKKHKEIDDELDNEGVEWPQSEEDVENFFHSLSDEQGKAVLHAFEKIAHQA